MRAPLAHVGGRNEEEGGERVALSLGQASKEWPRIINLNEKKKKKSFPLPGRYRDTVQEMGGGRKIRKKQGGPTSGKGVTSIRKSRYEERGSAFLR